MSRLGTATSRRRADFLPVAELGKRKRGRKDTTGVHQRQAELLESPTKRAKVWSPWEESGDFKMREVGRM